MASDGSELQDRPAATLSIETIHRRLADEYGVPVNREPSEPTEELVRTILSQNTNDTNRDRAFRRMRTQYRSWEDVARADTAALADTIRPGGLADLKAPRIQRALEEIRSRAGAYDLSFVCSMPTPEADRWLRALPGVGPKTAACVLLFSCQKPVMPVDTHVRRVSDRLGLIPPGTGADAAHAILTARVPAELIYPLHINLIRHGRLICRAGTPLCHRCVLRDLCAYARARGLDHYSPRTPESRV
ncbi:MAG: endonuclease III [Anaerolineae bacterium]|nr:endonuclease III [Anaerolineae bacterium]